MSLCESLNLLITTYKNDNIYTFDILKKSKFKLLKKIPNTSISSIDYNHNNSRIACGTFERKIIIILRANPEKNTVPILAHKSTVTNVKFHPISNFLASASFDQTIKLWNLDIADEHPVIFDEHDSWVYSIAFSKDGERLVSGGRDKTVRTFVVNQELLVKDIEAKVNRNFSNSEWNYFIGTDIPFEKTLH